MKYAGILLLSAVALACLAFYCRVKREGFKEDDRPAESKSGALEQAYDEMEVVKNELERLDGEGADVGAGALTQKYNEIKRKFPGSHRPLRAQDVREYLEDGTVPGEGGGDDPPSGGGGGKGNAQPKGRNPKGGGERGPAAKGPAAPDPAKDPAKDPAAPDPAKDPALDMDTMNYIRAVQDRLDRLSQDLDQTVDEMQAWRVKRLARVRREEQAQKRDVMPPPPPQRGAQRAQKRDNMPPPPPPPPPPESRGSQQGPRDDDYDDDDVNDNDYDDEGDVEPFVPFMAY